MTKLKLFNKAIVTYLKKKINIGGKFNNGENGANDKVDPVVSSIAARMKSIQKGYEIKWQQY